MFFCVTIFSGTIKATILKLGISIDNELLYRGIENWADCSYSYLYLSIFLSFRVNLCHSFSRNYASYKPQKWHTYGEQVIVSWG